MSKEKNQVKVIGMYLPQYHAIPENSKFWGEGFTDWVSVKKATPLFDGHDQPRVPLNDYYYDLSKKESIKYQVDLANNYGLYGFGIYHYWFNDEKNLLTKPAEIILENKDLDIPFFFAWDNISWKRTWSNIKGNDWAPTVDGQIENKEQSKFLVEYILGDKPQWKNHFDYLLPFFKDDRYIKKDGKPMFFIYHYAKELEPMEEYWNDLAKENGLDGVSIVYRDDLTSKPSKGKNVFHYEPAYSGWGGFFTRAIAKIKKKLKMDDLKVYSYDKTFRKIIKTAKKNKSQNVYHGCFVNYDDTPRRGKRGKAVVGGTPEKFAKYLTKLIKINKEQNKEFLFLTAWNEWGEGAYLEPDKTSGLGYLEGLKKAVEEGNE